jgi:hypothetical protein
MSKKQVDTSAAKFATTPLPGAEGAAAHPAANAAENSTIPKTINIKAAAEQKPGAGPSNLFISVKTFDAEGKTVGERIVDMYHFGTRNWLQNHHWWAMHNGHCVETNVATADEVTGYLAASKEALAAKFNTKAVAA